MSGESLLSCRARLARRRTWGVRFVRYRLTAEVWRGAWLRIAMMRTMLFPTLAYLVVSMTVVLAQDDAPIPPSPFDRVIQLELSAEDPVFIEGRGPTQAAEYLVEFDGTLHVWTNSELDLYLRVDDVVGMSTLAEDDNSGGGSTPYLMLEVKPGDLLSVFVVGPEDAAGALSLHLVAAPESATTREAAATLGVMQQEIESLRIDGDLDSARELLSKSISFVIEQDGMKHSEACANALWDIGFDASFQGSLAECSKAWRQALRHRERTLPADHLYRLDARANVALPMHLMGDLAGARVIWEEVLVALERTLPLDHPALLEARLNLATSRYEMGDLAGARALDEAVLSAYERTLPADHPDTLSARMNLANSMVEMGDLADSHALLEEVLAARERTLPADHPDLLSIQNNLAVSMSAMGDLAGAHALLEAAHSGYERTLPADHPELLSVRVNLAASMHEMGDLAGARALREAVLSARERTLPADHPDILGARANLAISMSAMGDLPGARALREAVLFAYERTLPANHPEVLFARANLATSMQAMGDLVGARALREAVLSVTERALPADHPQLLSARANLAVSMSAMGDLAGARALRVAVLSAFERTLPTDHPDRLRAHVNLAISMSAMGDPAGARAQCETICSGMQARVLGSLALAPRQARQTVRAEGNRLAAVHFFSGGAESKLLSRVFEVAETMRLVASESARSLGQFEGDSELAPLLEQADSARRKLSDLIADGGLDDDSAKELTTLSLERDRLERQATKILAARGVATEPIAKAALAKSLGVNEVVVGFRRLAVWHIDDESRRIEDSADHLFAQVLRSTGVLARVDLGPAAELEELATDWRAALGAPLLRGVALVEIEGNREARAGLELRRRMIDPVLAAAGEDVQRLFVCADDLVFLLPLDALPMDEGGAERLGDRVKIVNEVSFARLSKSEGPVKGAPSLLALGGVDYDADGAVPQGLVAASAPITDEVPKPSVNEPVEVDGDEHRETRGKIRASFRSLPQTRREAEAVADSFADVFDLESTLLTRDETTKAALFEAAAGKRFVHIATHGWFAPESVRSQEDAPTETSDFTRMGLDESVRGFAPMLLCGLALAGANNGRDSLGRVTGILTAEELCSLDLSRCELAVLSGCETNVGIRRAGQGIQSLQAALYAAGARTSITSLWEVDDAATRDLMETFYANLWEKRMGKAEALWEAKNALRADGDPPSAWAGWVLTGDPN